MTSPDAKPTAGLEGVIATSSAICYLDGPRGVLAYCGLDIHDLATHATFEEVCYLLWHRCLPTRVELGDLRSQLASARVLGEPMLRLMRSLPPGNAMDALRTLTSALAHFDPEATNHSPEASYRKAVRLTREEKQIDANVDFYSASTYYLLGIPIDLFTPIFAASRVSGWTAHILEQYATNRLIRPRAEYIGPPFPQTFVSLDRR